MKALYWIPIIGVGFEAVRVLKQDRDNYLSDFANPFRFYLSIVWHGLWIGLLPAFLPKLFGAG